MSYMRLYVIRHGMTEANEKRLCYGCTDIPLSEQGREKLAELKAEGIYTEADKYVTSSLMRTAETLSILYDRKPDIIIEEFNEMNFGEFEMVSYESLGESDEWRNWADGGSSAVCPCGESLDVFMDRVARGLKKLVSVDTESVVLICHGGVIISIMNRYFPGRENFYSWQPECGKGYVLDISDDITATLVGEI